MRYSTKFQDMTFTFVYTKDGVLHDMRELLYLLLIPLIMFVSVCKK